MIGPECLCVDDWWLSINGEQYFVDKDQYFHDQQENFEQGKYCMGSSLLSYSHKSYFNHTACVYLDYN